MNEEQQFLEDIMGNTEETPSESTEETQVPTEESEEEEKEARPRNRRERRLEAKLQEEREAGIAMAARLQVLSEVRETKDDPDYLKSLERIFGTDTPEATAATELLKNAMKGVSDQARQQALDALREEQRQNQEQVRTEESALDEMVDDIEDEYGISLTKDQEKGFFRLMEKLSPKDKEGNILQFADHRAVFEEYQERMKRSTGNKAKDLAARSMTQSGASSSQPAAQDAELKFLIENGII